MVHCLFVDMATINELTGLKEVLLNLQRQNAALAAGCQRGLKTAGLMLQRESQRLVPVNFGVLKNSAFTRARGKGLNTIVIVGYTASYAPYVHEAVGMVLKGQPRPKNRGKYWDPQNRAQAKFLEEPYRRLQPQIVATVKKHMKII